MSVSRILELLAQIDKANAEHSPSRRADYADALVDELRDIFPDDRLSEIAQAERDGRLVVLRPAQKPSKDGKERPGCFYTDMPGREYCMAYCHSKWDDEPIDACKECWYCDGNDDFRAEAEAALEGAEPKMEGERRTRNER